jgi:large subunit ribosomal protein L30
LLDSQIPDLRRNLLMILVIRISGMIDVPREMRDTLDRIRLRRKYAAVLLEDNRENRMLLSKVRNLVAYGNVSTETIAKLIELRGEPVEGRKSGKKVDAKKVAEQVGKKKLDELGVKPFFRLHPPRKGIESKKHFGVGKGVLGDHKDKINDLLEKML